MKIQNVLKDHNYESPDSTLKVKYIASYGNSKTQKYIHINPSLYKINPYTPKIRYKINDLRKEQFNSFSNENMDFFRLDHLAECDRNNYHNKFMDNIQPVKRSANFDKFNDLSKNIKYLDYLKQNYLLNQNKTINSNIYSERDLEIAQKRKNYYTNKSQILPKINSINLEVKKGIIDENLNNINDNNSFNLDRNYNGFNSYNRNKNNPYRREINKSNSTIDIGGCHLYKNINNYNDTLNNNRNNSINKKLTQSYSNSYLPNINDYSIKEGDINLYEDKTKYKLYPTFQKDTNDNEKFKQLYNQDRYRTLLNNNPFYIAYNENSKNGGFFKKNGDFSNYERLYKNKFFFRNNNNLYDDKRNQKMNSFFHNDNIPYSFSNNNY